MKSTVMFLMLLFLLFFISGCCRKTDANAPSIPHAANNTNDSIYLILDCSSLDEGYWLGYFARDENITYRLVSKDVIESCIDIPNRCVYDCTMVKTIVFKGTSINNRPYRFCVVSYAGGMSAVKELFREPRPEL